MWFLLLLGLWMPQQVSEIARIEKVAAGKPQRVLVPAVSAQGNIHLGAELYDAPSGTRLLQVPRGLPAFLLETKGEWHKVAILEPFVLEGWVPRKSVSFIINANTLFYSGPRDENPRGLVNQGLMVFPRRTVGDMMEVDVHHHTPVRIWVPAGRVGIRFESNTHINYRYQSRWNRFVFECEPGPLYADRNSQVVVATLLEKAYFKKESETAGWVEIAVVSDYDMRFKAWVPAKRMGTQSQYYYSYQYSFRVNQTLQENWFRGGFQTARPVSAQVQPVTSPKSLIHLRSGTPVSHIIREPSGLYAITMGRRNYYFRPNLSTLLDALEGVNMNQYYVSQYDQMWVIRAWLPLTLLDLTVSQF